MKPVTGSGEAHDGEARGQLDGAFAALVFALAAKHGAHDLVVAAFDEGGVVGGDVHCGGLAEGEDVLAFAKAEELSGLLRAGGADVVRIVDGEDEANLRRADLQLLDDGGELVAHRGPQRADADVLERGRVLETEAYEHLGAGAGQFVG